MLENNTSKKDIINRFKKTRQEVMNLMSNEKEIDVVEELRKMREDIKNQTSNITKSYGDEVRQTYMDNTGLNLYDNKAAAESTVSRDSKIENYAKQHGMDYNSAENLLVSRGYKPTK